MTVLNDAIPPIFQDAPSRPAAPSPYGTYPDGRVYKLVPISERHIELKTQLYDVVTSNYFVELQWLNPDKSQGHDTVLQGVIDNKTKLLNLSNKNAPISAANVTEIMAYLKYQAEHTQPVHASSQLGWQGKTFVLPGGSTKVIGIEEEPWQPQGDKEAFRAALKKLIGWGQTPALMAMFASAAAPAVRLAKLNRNPILSFSSTSGTGKSTCTAAALSLWTTTERSTPMTRRCQALLPEHRNTTAFP